MSRYNPQQAPVSYPPPVVSYPPPGQAYPPADSNVAASPPMGYPTKDGSGYPQQSAPVQTTTRGEGFWEGCCAAICCCCALDCCL